MQSSEAPSGAVHVMLLQCSLCFTKEITAYRSIGPPTKILDVVVVKDMMKQLPDFALRSIHCEAVLSRFHPFFGFCSCSVIRIRGEGLRFIGEVRVPPRCLNAFGFAA
jgi:hypothetical protein